MKEYWIKASFRSKYIIRLLISLIIAAILPGLIFNYLELKLDLVPFLGIGFLFMYFTKSLSRQNVRIIMDSMGLKLIYQKNWLKQIHEHQYLWNSIQEYLFQEEQYFTLFRLKLKDGSTLKLSHDRNDSDDFKMFENDFVSQIENLNNSITDANKIKTGKTIYETKLGTISAYLLVIILIALPIIIWLRGIKYNWGTLLMLYSGGIFFIYSVYFNNRKK